MLVAQLCPNLRNNMGCSSPPGSSIHGILQARILQWIAIFFSRGISRDWTWVSCIAGRFFTTEPQGKPLKFIWKWKVLSRLLTLCDPMDDTVHEILQARTLEWVAFPFSRGSSQRLLTLCDPMDDTVHEILQARTLEWVAFPFSRGSSQPRDQTQVSALQADSLPAEPPGETKNTGVGRLSLLQQIFLTQEPNRGLLHCRRILYQLNYQGST